MGTIDFEKGGGIVPVVIQDARSNAVLMLGYMNAEALEATKATGILHFWSRSRKCLWKKGETSGNTLTFVDMHVDCDGDALLIRALPAGPTCHTGQQSCFFSDTELATGVGFLADLGALLHTRKTDNTNDSYVADLLARGLDRTAQKVGEEGVEVVIAAKNNNREEFLGESADLLFHLLVLLEKKDEDLYAVIDVLRERHQKK